MMKRVFMLSLVLLFLYTLTFDIFLNRFFRIPTPIISCIPLIILFREQIVKFLYTKEILIYSLCAFGYYSITSGTYDTFVINLIVFGTAALYFNYFVGTSIRRLNLSVAIFFALLLFSTIVMLLNQFNGRAIVGLRSLLIGAEVRQSPSGISSTIFNFGYQLAPFVTFIFVYACAAKRNLLIISSVFIFSMIAIYFGLQRSVLVAFILAGTAFAVLYYKSKSVLILSILLFGGVLFYIYAMDTVTGLGSDNILAKSERDGGTNSRDGLFSANIDLMTDYPYGLIFHGTNWKEVARNYPAFSGGLTSHNAYLMFLTYFGPIVGAGLLFLLYNPIYQVTKRIYRNINLRENSLLVCLCFAFFAVSINAMFHNAWLLNSNGPTVFLYFCCIHLNKLLLWKVDTINETLIIEQEPKAHASYLNK